MIYLIKKGNVIDFEGRTYTEGMEIDLTPSQRKNLAHALEPKKNLEDQKNQTEDK